MTAGLTVFLAFGQLFTLAVSSIVPWEAGSGSSAPRDPLLMLLLLVLLPRLAGSLALGAHADRRGARRALRTCLGLGVVTSAGVSVVAAIPAPLQLQALVGSALLGCSAFVAGGVWPIVAVRCALGAKHERRGRAGLAPQLGVLAAVLATGCLGLLAHDSLGSSGVHAGTAVSHAALALALLLVRRSASVRERDVIVRANPHPRAGRRSGVGAISRRSRRRVLLAGIALTTSSLVFSMATSPVIGSDAVVDRLRHPGASADLILALCTMAAVGSAAALASDVYSRQRIVLAGTALTTLLALGAMVVRPDGDLLALLLTVPAALPYGCGAALLPALFPSEHRTICVGIASTMGAAGGGTTYALAAGAASPVGGASALPAIVAVVGSLSTLCIAAVIHDTALDPARSIRQQHRQRPW